MTRDPSHRLLVAYSTVLTATLCVVLLQGAMPRPEKAAFDEIDVRRINLVEPDGTLRLVIASKARFPGTYVQGVEKPRSDRQTAGILFLDDEASETGGLVWGGGRDAEGHVESHGHLSFDQYRATQVFAVSAWEEKGERVSRAVFTDWREREGESGKDRLVLGRFADRSAGIELKDARGRTRLRIRAGADGSPAIEVLEPDGSVSRRWPD
jgi:hypothetical protein